MSRTAADAFKLDAERPARVLFPEGGRGGGPRLLRA
jgi:hypothetical protein